jgi:hypothetical protein
MPESVQLVDTRCHRSSVTGVLSSSAQICGKGLWWRYLRFSPKLSMMRVWVTGLATLALACGAECEKSRCTSVDLAPGANDYVMELDSGTAFVYFVINGFESDQGLVGGEVAVEPDHPSCVASSDNPCAISLKRLRLRLSSATLPTSEGHVTLEDPVLSVEAPQVLVDSGSGYFVPRGTGVQTCMSVDGRADSARTPLASDARMLIDLENDGFSLQGSFPVRFHVEGGECKVFDATANVVSSGRGPWVRKDD